MRTLVYGAGAVGCYVGAHLILAGHEVTLIGRERVTRTLQTAGLVVRKPEPVTLTSVRAATSLQDALKADMGYDLILLTVKAYDTLPAIEDLQSHLTSPLPILCLQNGVGNEDSLGAAFGRNNVIAGTLTTAVTMDTPGIVVVEKERGIALAADSAAFPIANRALARTALRLQTLQDGRAVKWSKLLLNIIGNATSAILDLPPYEIFKDRRLFAVEIAALREALSVMRLLHIGVANLPGIPVSLLAFAVNSLPASLLQLLLKDQFASGRGDKLPSLTMALRNRQSRTEVAWLNGAVAHAASQVNRLAPINHALALIISDIASARVPWAMYRHKPQVFLTAIRAASGLQHWRYGE